MFRAWRRITTPGCSKCSAKSSSRAGHDPDPGADSLADRCRRCRHVRLRYRDGAAGRHSAHPLRTPAFRPGAGGRPLLRHELRHAREHAGAGLGHGPLRQAPAHGARPAAGGPGPLADCRRRKLFHAGGQPGPAGLRRRSPQRRRQHAGGRPALRPAPQKRRPQPAGRFLRLRRGLSALHHRRAAGIARPGAHSLRRPGPHPGAPDSFPDAALPRRAPRARPALCGRAAPGPHPAGADLCFPALLRIRQRVHHRRLHLLLPDPGTSQQHLRGLLPAGGLLDHLDAGPRGPEPPDVEAEARGRDPGERPDRGAGPGRARRGSLGRRGGRGVASIYPTTLGLAGTRFEEYSGTVFGILFAVALVGGMSLPWALGQIGAARGLRTALALPVAAFLAIFLLQTVISRKLAARRPALKLIALLLLAAAAARAADFLPVAVWYGGGKARAPMLEPDPQSKKELWRRDLRQIRALGFNAIRCWIDWASAEPAEGRYRFDTIDVLLELARKEGLKVIIQTYMDAAPDWVGRKFPDSFYVAASGEVMRPESAPGYCVDHPGVRRAEEAFFTALARRAAQSPAFLGWDLWSEPHVINWATANYLLHPEFCFCPASIRRFRAWLQHKYASLEALNQAWYRQFTSWDQVEPGRLSTILSYTDYIDWRNFIQQKLGEDLRLRYEAVKRGAPDRIATSHAAIPSLFTSPLAGDGSPDDWIMARQVDFYGTSFYPKHSRPVGYDVAWRAALLDFERSSAFSPQGHGGFGIGELQAGFGTVALNVSATVTADDLRDWTWSALSRGAKGINFYAWYPMSTGYESGGYGLIQLDGTLTARSRVAGEIARVVDRHQRLFLDARPPKAHVAIIFNPLSYMIGGRQRAATTAGPQSEVGSIERDSWLGAYRALFPTNVPVDFLHAGELSAALLAQYKLVLFPYPLMIPEKAGALLREYVRAGGTLVSEARLAWTSETGRASETIPGLGLVEVTGCRETDVHSVPGLRTELRWTDAAIPGVRPGDRLAARVYEETLEPAGLRARAVAVFPSGAPAAVLSAFGRGRTLTLGSYLAVAYEAQKDPAVARFFAGLLEWAGVERPVEVAEGEAEVRFLESGAERLVFVFNHADQATTPRITLHLPATRATDLLTGQPVPLSAPALTLRKMLAPHEVWILRIL